jgi:hypothetical protein
VVPEGGTAMEDILKMSEKERMFLVGMKRIEEKKEGITESAARMEISDR